MLLERLIFMYDMEHQMVPIPSLLHSKFKELSNEYSHAQIRVKTKKLWPRQVGEKNRLLLGKYVATRRVCCDRKVCRDRKYVATSSMSRQAICRDRCRNKQYVATDVAASSMS